MTRPLGMQPRNVIALTLLLASYAAFVPGITKPLITIEAGIEIFGAKMELFRETRSILQTVTSLRDSGNEFVAGLIFLFGVVVPIVKGLMLVGSGLLVGRAHDMMDVIARNISKWAMSDVFVVAVYVAFLSARATDNLDAQLESGFYWFAAYVLLSLLSLNFLRWKRPTESAPAS